MEGVLVILCTIALVYSQQLNDHHRDGHAHVDYAHNNNDGHQHDPGHDNTKGHHHGDGHAHVDYAHNNNDGHQHDSGHDNNDGHHHGDGHAHVDYAHNNNDGHAPDHDKTEGHYHEDGHAHVDARSYLTKFGYLNPFSFGERTLNNSIKIFQNTFGLKVTGTLDKDTEELMEQPRCGMQDHRLGYSDRSWTTTELTYSFDNYTPDMEEAVVHKVIKQALDYWAAVTPLSFKLKTGKDADIVISFGSKTHSDHKGKCFYDFDGPNGVLAHAFFPESGRIHFDEAEDFTAHSARGINFLWVATHELGHILGLEHDTKHIDAVMYPYYRSYSPDFKLHTNDIKRIRALYGSENGDKISHACQDKINTCEKHRIHCKSVDKNWSKLMNEKCMKTCGMCNGGTGCHPKPHCRDIARNCSQFKNNCKDFGRHWRVLMSRKCKKTCGLCC